MLYLQESLFGIPKELKAKNIVIDEAQDYSFMELLSLKKSLDTDMFTLVGDLAQGIHSYRGLISWQEVLDFIFPRATYTELQKSYRTTVEIMEKAGYDTNGARSFFSKYCHTDQGFIGNLFSTHPTGQRRLGNIS